MIDLHRLRAAMPLALAFASAALQAQDMTAAGSLAATCANCHGTNGQARGEMASLSGWPADKTIAALDAFRSGAQPTTVMQQIAKGYTDDQLRLIAAYFAAQPAAR